MLLKLKTKFIKNIEIFILGFLIFITIISTSYYNFNKNKILKNYKDTINNVYLKKTIDHFLNTLEPKFKKIEHKVSAGETFDKILEEYSVNKSEIEEIKKNLLKKVNLDKLKTDQKIQLTNQKMLLKILFFNYQIQKKYTLLEVKKMVSLIKKFYLLNLTKKSFTVKI